MPGKKIAIMRLNPQVCILVEDHLPNRGWTSVVINGTFEELTDSIGSLHTRAHAWSLLSTHAEWWEPGVQANPSAISDSSAAPVYFSIRIEEMSGREARDI